MVETFVAVAALSERIEIEGLGLQLLHGFGTVTVEQATIGLIPAIEFFQERLDLWISMEAFDLGLEHIVRAHTAKLQAVQELHFRPDGCSFPLTTSE